MTGAGRPFRFLVLVLGGWIAMRVAMLWPPAERMVDILTADARARAAPVVSPPFRPIVPDRAQRPAASVVQRITVERTEFLPRPQVAAHAVSAPALPVTRTETPPASPSTPVGIAPTEASRWSASVWLIARGTGASTLAPGGTLGGSQAGVRVAWRPAEDLPAAIFVRLSRPLRTPGAEAAIGIEVQPHDELPVRLALEQRFALERGAAEGTAVSVIGGVSDAALPGGFALDGYGQAGVIGLRQRAAFVDGAASVTRPLTSVAGAEIRVGAGIWGAAQPRLARLDIGPRAELRVPIAGQRIRIGAEWRERIAGNARPGSGPAVTIGADF